MQDKVKASKLTNQGAIDSLTDSRGPDSRDSDSRGANANTSPLAQAVNRLKQASFKTARERERVPQPLFWSLFRTEIDSIKEKKQTKRLLSDIFGANSE